MPSYSGLYNETGGYTMLVNKAPMRNRSRIFSRGNGTRVITELFDTLIGAAAGGSASKTFPQIANDADNAGKRKISTITAISRVSTSADVAMLKEIVFNVKRAPATYPRDASGNGGGTFSPVYG